MKAWKVTDKNLEEFFYIGFGDTKGKARRYALRHIPAFEDCDWTDLRLRVAPRLDGEPHEVMPREVYQAGYRQRCGGLYCEQAVSLEDFRDDSQYPLVKGDQVYCSKDCALKT